MKISFFPSRSINIKTLLSVAQAFEHLEASMNPSKTKELYMTEGTFMGEIKPPNFTLLENVPPKSNSFIPLLRGNIRQEAGQTLVTVKMELGGCILAFAAVWCYTPCWMLLLNIDSWLRGGEFSPTIFFVSLGALSVMWAMMNFGFRDGETAAKAFLIKTFDGELV